MRRRTVLTTALGAAFSGVAGCASSGGPDMSLRNNANLEIQPVSDAEIAAKFIGTPASGSTYPEQIATTGSVLTRDLPPQIGENESNIVYNGTVYHIKTDVESGVGIRYQVSVEAAPDAPVKYQFEDLPPMDRKAIRPLIDSPNLGVSGPATYIGTEQNDSVLVAHAPEPVTIARDQRGINVTLSDPVDIKRYKLTVIDTESARAVGQQLRSRYEFQLEGLSDEAREIVTTAIEQREYRIPASEEPSAAFRTLVARLNQGEPVRRKTGATIDSWFIVQFEREVYWAELVLNREEFTPIES